jgi:GTP-binding protein
LFVDQVHVVVKAGRGGNGCVSFRRESKVPRGGPDGGRGGDGGSVFLVSEFNLNSLVYFRFHPLNRAKNGKPGEGSNRQGKRGEDIVLRVPVGTIVREEGREEILHDFLEQGVVFLAAKGGKGGRGNASYATATHQTPREFQPGRPGEEKDLFLELKIIADIGLVGFPNVGKSTLISGISAARPVVADYPFTTLTPNLGVVEAGGSRRFVVADIPGLIAGAHEGHGLGIRFLKHIERTKILVHLIDVSPATGRDPADDYAVVIKELEAYDPALAARPKIIVANKTDALGGRRSRLEKVRRLAVREGAPFFAVSALTGKGLKELADGMARALESPGRAEGNVPE